jgi:general secretion pathway protein K
MTVPRARKGKYLAAHYQKGIALVMVLWILLLVTISTGAYTIMARMDQLEAHTVLSGTQARLAAEAGMNIAILALRDTDEATRLIPDGRPYLIQYRGIAVEVQITDERGKLDVNQADEETLFNMLSGHGMEPGQAELLAAAIKDWTDPDEIERYNGAELETYEGQGLGVGPGNRNFIMSEELLQVLGMPWELYIKMEPGVTVYSETGKPNVAYAPVEALLALPDITAEDALNFVEQRHSEDSLDGTGPALPDGTTAMVQGRGLTYSILAKATLPNGIWDQIEATIRLGGSSDGRPFRVLRWREGFHH